MRFNNTGLSFRVQLLEFNTRSTRKFSLFIVLLALTALLTPLDTSANGSSPTISEKKIALTLLEGQIDREIINMLKLSEVQYIRLKELNKLYKVELAGIGILTSGNTFQVENRTNQLANRYYVAMNKVLTPKQIKAYINEYSKLLTYN